MSSHLLAMTCCHLSSCSSILLELNSAFFNRKSFFFFSELLNLILIRERFPIKELVQRSKKSIISGFKIRRIWQMELNTPKDLQNVLLCYSCCPALSWRRITFFLMTIAGSFSHKHWWILSTYGSNKCVLTFHCVLSTLNE